MNKVWIILFLIMIPGALFAQSFQKSGIMAFTYIQNENYHKAIDSLDILLSEKPNAEYYLAKAEVYFKLGEYDKAKKLCEKADKLKLNCASELNLRIALSLQNREDAIQALNANLKSRYKVSLFDLLNSPKFTEIYTLEIDDYVLSESYYSKTEKQIYQAERLIQNHKYDQALFLVDQILSIKNNIADAHYLRSVILLKQENLQSALYSINKAIENKKTVPVYYKQRIAIKSKLKKYNEALNDANKLVRLEPYRVENYIIKTDLLFKTENYTQAIELSELILEILPSDPDVLYLSSKANYKNKDYLEALKAINQSMEIKTSKDYFELRGDIYSATKTYQYAIQDYSMFLDIEPYNGSVYAKKGWARYNSGDKNGACSDWEKAKRYGSFQAIQYLEKYCE